MDKLMMFAPPLTLNSGHKMPRLGFGTASRPAPPHEQLKSVLIEAFESGFRHVDTATSYGTESTVGKALSEAVDLGVVKDRDEIFVASKLFVTDTQRDLVLPALKRTLDKLGLEYVDLYLIHWPMTMKPSAATKYPFKLSGDDMLHFDLKQVWEAMEECCKLGLAKSICVSNFSCAKLSKLLEFAKIIPAVNQVEMNVAWQQNKLLEFCKEKNIHVCAYSPLGANGTAWGSNSVMENQILKEIADAKSKSVAQVALRWIYEQGVTPIVKSFNKDRMKQNLQIFDWELTEEERCKIQNIPQRRIVRGENFVFPEGQYKSVEELWDGEI